MGEVIWPKLHQVTVSPAQWGGRGPASKFYPVPPVAERTREIPPRMGASQLTFILLTFVIVQEEKWKFNFTVQWAGEILTSLLRQIIVLIGASLYKKINWKMN